ncbi:S1 family peptidase [Faucicola boevrei]|uniref:S1 family peptidase n=1 Tax=Faucicola boevrei TaxID=346665 RepID=UPI00037E3F82|nr:serine protease [Moraxella boevrei]
MQHLPLGANTVLANATCQIHIKSANARLSTEIGLLWLVMDSEKKALISPAYLHENKDWASFDAEKQTWQLQLNQLFEKHHAKTVQLIAYAYDTAEMNLPAVEINAFELIINDTISYQYHAQERHVKASILLEIYERNGQYKVRALAENSTQHLSNFAQKLQISLDARHPTFYQGLHSEQSPAQRRPQSGETWTGTAFAIDPYHLLTCHHVIDGANLIGLRQEGLSDIEAQVLISDEGSDTAVLKVKEPLPHYLPIRVAGVELLGEQITTLGFPLSGLSSQLQVTQGNIAGLRGIGGDIRFIQFTAPIQAGSSGSPLLLATGEVVGMVTHTISNAQNMNYAVKYQLLSAIIASGGLTLNELPQGQTLNFTTPQLAKNSRSALWLVGCQA